MNWSPLSQLLSCKNQEMGQALTQPQGGAPQQQKKPQQQVKITEPKMTATKHTS